MLTFLQVEWPPTIVLKKKIEQTGEKSVPNNNKFTICYKNNGFILCENLNRIVGTHTLVSTLRFATIPVKYLHMSQNPICYVKKHLIV